MFSTYLELGLRHILDPQGYDHILFIISIGILFFNTSFRTLLILVTAFTFGHSVTLALTSLDVISVSSRIVEICIPITIIISCFDNIYGLYKRSSIKFRYVTILLFGLIHGMGFSTFFKSIIGSEDNIIWPLLSFNIGIEVAQILLIIAIILLLYPINKTGIRSKYIITTVSLLVAGLASWLLFQQF